MKLSAKRILIHLLYPVVCIGFFSLLWWAAARVTDNDMVFPSLEETFAAMGTLFGLKKFWTAFGWTLLRTVIAFLISALFAIALAALAEKYRVAARIVSPFISVMRALPTVAVVLILVLWMDPKFAPVVVSTLVVLPTLYSSMRSAFASVDRGLLQMSEVYRVPKARMLGQLYLPATLPVALPALATGLSLTLKLMVAAEVLAKTAQSIGGLMEEAESFYARPRLYALVVVTVAVAILIEAGFSALARRAVKWA